MDLTVHASASAITDLDMADAYQGPAILLPCAYWRNNATQMRARRVTEQVKLDRQGEWVYTITVSGPLQTKTGKDHAAQSDDLEYRAEPVTKWSRHKTVDEFPEVLKPYLHGRDALLAELRGTVDTAA